MKTNEYDVIIVSCIGHMFYVISTLHHTLLMCDSLIQGGGGEGAGGSYLSLEIIRPMLVLFVHINIRFVLFSYHLTHNIS